MKKRFLAIVLVMVVLLTCSACGNKEKTEDPKKEQTSVEKSEPETEATEQPKYVYQATYSPLNLMQSDFGIQWINQFAISDQNLYFMADCRTGEQESHTDEFTGEVYTYDRYESNLFVMDLNTKQLTKLDTPKQELPEGMEGSSYVSGLSAAPNGTVYVCLNMETYTFDLPEDFNPETDDQWNYYTQGENKCTMMHYDAAGTMLHSVDIQYKTDEGFAYFYNLITDASGYIYASDWQKNYIFDAEGKFVTALEGTGDQLVKISETEIATFVYGEEGRSLKIIDPVAKDYGAEVPVSDRAWNLKPGYGEYQYLYDNNGTVYGHVEATGEDVLIFNWLDSDVNSNNIDNFSIMPDGRIIALERDHSGETPVYNLITMNQVDASTLPQKEQLVLACMYLDYDIRNEIIKFNKNHSDIRITVKDYSQYATDEDYLAGITKLNTEILSGSMPDIIMTSDMPMDQYIGQGVLLDLWPMIDNDPELSREDLMTHFFDTLSVDGKLYQTSSYFSISSAIGNRDIVGDGTQWTLDDLLDALSMLEPDATIFGKYDTKSGILHNCISRSIGSFIDWETGKCSFDSQEFLDYLEFANQFPLEYDWENEDPEEEYVSDYVKLRTGQQLLMQSGIWSFDELQYNNAIFEGKASYVGYPSTQGNHSSFNIGNGLAITSGCKNPEAAWAFVRTMLTEAHQRSEHYYQFPTNKNCFDEYVAQAMTKEYYIDPETGEQKEQSKGTWWIDDNNTVEIFAMTQEEYDLFIEVYERCNSVQTYNNKIMTMITEEVAPYFEGQKTAQEVAALIQNKVSLFVMEDM